MEAQHDRAREENSTPLMLGRSPDDAGREKRRATQKLRKVQFTVDEETIDKLELSKELNNDSSLVQSFRRAAAMAAFFDKMRKDGYEVLVKKGDDVYKIFIP